MQRDYLEDFIDKIGHCPNDVSTILTQMRMGDLKAKRDNDLIQRKTQHLFDTGMSRTPQQQKAEYEEICALHEKVKGHSKEKLSLADKKLFMLDKILKHLDNVITKYTNEMENQQPGITATLRTASLDLDQESRDMSSDPRANRPLKRKMFEEEEDTPLPQTEPAAPTPSSSHKRQRTQSIDQGGRASGSTPGRGAGAVVRGASGASPGGGPARVAVDDKQDKRKMSILPEGTKVVSRLQAGEANWVLTKVIKFRSGRYIVADLDPNISDEFTLHRKDVLPLTGESVVFAAGEQVLALYPETTCFYPAIVVSKLRRNGKQYYRLHFEDDENVDGSSRTTDLPAIDCIKHPGS